MRIYSTIRMIVAVGLLTFACLATAQSADEAKVSSPASSKFGNIPGLPTCLTAAAQHGDPMAGPAILLARAKPGCVVPWHWHTNAERLMIVSGTATIAMKGGKPEPLASGSFANLPAKHQHEFRAKTPLLMFIALDGAFDIHYVDASGNEIPAEQALKAGAKTGASKSGTAKPETKKPNK